MVGPALPARKAGGKRTGQPTSRSAVGTTQEFATLEDGTQVPLAIPPGLPPAQAQAIIAYLKENPAAAKAAYDQAQAMLRNPAMARSFMNMHAKPDAAMLERFSILKDDPELHEVFQDIQTNGVAAMQKYWDDEQMMLKISKKLQEADKALGVQDPSAQPEGQPASPPARVAATLHDAAKLGDLAAATQFLDEGADVNAKNERGITPLGIAVGFNKVAVAELLVARGADVHFKDPAGNSLMHYAAGYGRRQMVDVLLAAGCDINAANNAQQRPIDAARMNREMTMVALLTEKGADASGVAVAPSAPAGSDAAASEAAAAADSAASPAAAPAAAKRPASARVRVAAKK